MRPQLNHFTSQHFILGSGITVELDTANVGTFTGIDGNHQIDRFPVLCHFRHALNISKCEAFGTQTLAQGFGGGIHIAAGENLTLFNGEQLASFVLADL